MPASAWSTGPARPDQRHDHSIAGIERFDVGTDLDHPTSCLVAVNGGQRPTPGTVEEGDVAVADRHRIDLDSDLVWERSAQIHVLDHEWLTE